jgi:hypothetical protein
MATKSFLKTINIADRSSGNAFSDAFIKCETSKGIDVSLKSSTKDVKGSEAIKQLLNGLKK